MMAIATAQTCAFRAEQNRVISVASRRIPELDGLRGGAILSVMAFHYLDALTNKGAGFLDYFHPVVAMGWTGVDLFFVLSGFLIGGILLDARTSNHYFKTFYIRRFCRIIPLYYAWICGYVVIYAALGATRFVSAGVGPEARPPLYIYFMFLQNLGVFHISGVAGAWFGATWSLAVEEQFYLITPLLIWLLPRRMLSLVLSGVVFCAPVLRFVVHNSGPSGPAVVNILTPCRADAFAMGILAAILWRNAKIRLYLAANAVVLRALLGASLTGFIVVAVKWHSRPWSLGMQTIGLTAIAFFFAVTLLFVLLRPAGTIASMVRTEWVRDIGGVSYCMYLTHSAVWGTCHDLLLPNSLRESGSWLGAGVAVLAGVLTYAIAKMSWDWFEKPLLLRGHAFHY
jgi:peptidoglycan/LPS O-acetylase OafA/YrhL